MELIDIPRCWCSPELLERFDAHSSQCAAVRRIRSGFSPERWHALLAYMHTRRLELVVQLWKHILGTMQNTSMRSPAWYELQRRRIELQALMVKSAAFLRILLLIGPQHFTQDERGRAEIYCREFAPGSAIDIDSQRVRPEDIEIPEFLQAG